MAFGKTGLDLDLPDGFDYQILRAHAAATIANARAAVEEALDHPLGTPPLLELAKGKKSAAISVCDITRPAPNRLVLPPMLERLEHAGIARENITILIATGLHRAAPQEEIEEIVGADIALRYRVVNHHAKELAEHRFLGNSSTGTPVYIDERFVAADLHITLGFIEPHLMLGFSGGRKLIAPGLAAQETIKILHSPKFMRDPRVVEGSIEDNPLHRELLEIASMAGHHFLVDTSLGRGTAEYGRKPITAVFAGDPRKAHAAGVKYVAEIMLERIAEPVDAVITTSAGYPLDMTFYQAIKGVTAASHIVKPGGRILLLAECSEGAGAHEFQAMVSNNPDDAKFLRKLEQEPVEVDQWQLEKLAMVTQKADLLYYVPGLPTDHQASLWGQSFPDIEGAMLALVAGLPVGAKIAVIPEGPYVLAKTGELVTA
jgi:nickel-dependent lactate racemase